MRIGKATQKAIRFACMHFHYAKKIPLVAEAYSIFNDADEWCGVIIYGPGANKYIASPFDKWQGQVIELVRVALNGKQGHGNTSKAVAMTIRQLKKTTPYELIVSYADLDQNHAGIIYQATNWIYIGTTKVGARCNFVILGKTMHPRSLSAKGWIQNVEWVRKHVDPNAYQLTTKGKHKYLYPLTPEMRKRFLPLARPYPCGSRSTAGQSAIQPSDGGVTPSLPLQEAVV